MTEVEGIVAALGGQRVLRFKVARAGDLIDASRDGLPFGVLNELEAATGLPMNELYRYIIPSHRTFMRRAQEGRLKPDESDRALRLARIAARAREALGDIEKAKIWLRSPIRALGMVTPLSLLDTDLGTQQVVDVLGRIEHGTFS